MKKVLVLLAVAVMLAFAAPVFAANPFVDVPMNHWAYDAISSLAAKGVLQGYPDGTYMGQKPITRYEFAVALAKALAHVDMTKASKEDVEMLKKLIVEFKDELDNLGVKVEEIDSRLAVVEKNLNGFAFSGVFRWDSRWYTKSGRDNAALYGDEETLNDMSTSRYRIIIKKQIDENVSFTARTQSQFTNWEYFYVTVKLPFDIMMNAGRFNVDWEDADGLYTDNDAFFLDTTTDGLAFTKAFSMGEFKFAWQKFNDNLGTAAGEPVEQDLYAAKVNFNLGEIVRIGVFYYMFNNYNFSEPYVAVPVETADPTVMGVDGQFTFAEGASFKFLYAKEELDAGDDVDDPILYKGIIDVSQDVLKFTSVWLEYAHFDDNAFTMNQPWDNYYFSVTPTLGNDELNVVFAKLTQKWSDKWGTFERFVNADSKLEGDFDTTNMSFGVTYQYTPSTQFEVVWDNIKYGDDLEAAGYQDNTMLRLRMIVNF